MDKGCSISNLVKVQQKAGGDGSGGSGSQENTKNGGTGASGDERLCPAAGGAGPRVVAGGSGSRDDRVGGGVGDGGGGGSDGGGGSGGGGGEEEPSGRRSGRVGTLPSNPFCAPASALLQRLRVRCTSSRRVGAHATSSRRVGPCVRSTTATKQPSSDKKLKMWGGESPWSTFHAHLIYQRTLLWLPYTELPLLEMTKH